MGYTWGQLAQDRDAWRALVRAKGDNDDDDDDDDDDDNLRLAQDRDAWRALVGSLCSSRSQRQ